MAHALAQGYELAGVDRRRGPDTNHGYAVARQVVRDGTAVLRSRTVTLEMCSAPRKQLDELFHVCADLVAPFVLSLQDVRHYVI